MMTSTLRYRPRLRFIEGGDEAGGDQNGAAGDGNDGGQDDAGDDGSDGDGDGGDDSDGDDEGADQLGDKGKQALDRMKARLKTEREARTKAERERDEAKGLTEAEKATRETEQKALDRANQRIVRSEIKAAAKGVLADPGDAYQFIDLDQFEVDDDGNVDEDEIAQAIADLIKKKPYLAAQGERRFKGSGDGGARKESRPSQLKQADLAGMSPAEILKAQKDGRLNDLLKS